MGRPKLPTFTAEDADTMGHLKAKMADLMRDYEQLKKKLSNQKLIAKKEVCSTSQFPNQKEQH